MFKKENLFSMHFSLDGIAQRCVPHAKASPDGLLHPAPVQLHARTSNLHGELLSVHKIKARLNLVFQSAQRAREREQWSG